MKGIDIVYHADNNTMELKDAPDDLLIGTDGDDYATYLKFQIIDDEGILDGFSPYVLFEVESRPMIGLDESYILNLTQDLLNKARYGKLPFMLVFKGKDSTIEIHSTNSLTLGIAHSIDADREVKDDTPDSELAIKYVEITYHAESRLMELTDMPDDQFVGTDGDDYATYLRFHMDDPDGLLTGYGARVEFDVSIRDENGDTYKPFIVIDESMSVPLIQRILSNVKYGAIPIQLAFKGTDSEGKSSQFYSLNKLRLSISDSIRALEGIDVNDRIDLNSVINSVEYNPKTATFSFRQIDGGTIAVQLSDLSEEHFEVSTKDDLKKLNKAQNGDTATTLDDGKWYKLYGEYSDPQSWIVMSPSVKAVDDHISDRDNPHNVTKAQIGLENVDDTSDIDKPISALTQEALDTKADSKDLSELSKIVSEEIADRESSDSAINESISNHVSDTNNPHNVTKEQLGLENVDNTSDVNKPISTATQEALDDKADKTTVSYLRMEFDEEVKVRSEEDTNIKADLDTKADKVETQNSLNDKANKTDVESALSTKADKLATEQALDSKADKSIMETALGLKADKTDVEMALDTKADKTTVSSLSNTLTKEIQDRVAGDNTNATAISTHATNKSNPHNVTKAQVGLGNVDNTSDANKPISTAVQNALNLKADKSEISSLYRPKGSVATYNDLPTTAQIGDVYDVQSTGMNYVWTGSKWDELGAIIDLSPYYTKTEVDSALGGKVSKSGDTMTGDLTINKLNPCVNLINTAHNVTTIPSSTAFSDIQFFDSTLTRVALLEHYRSDNNRKQLALILNSSETVGVENWGFMGLANDGYGTYGFAPNWSVGTNDNSDKVLTIAMANSLPSLVHSTGNETVAGIKTFCESPYINRYQASVNIQDNVKEMGVAPPQEIWNAINFMDKAKNVIGRVYHYSQTNGATGIKITTTNKVNDVNVTSTLQTLITSSGTPYATAPTTPSSATSNEIATANWSIGEFVALRGDQTINGVKSFATAPIILGGRIRCVNPNLPNQSAPSSITYNHGIIFENAKYKEVGAIFHQVNKNDTAGILYLTTRSNGTGYKEARMGLYSMDDGSAYAFCPTLSDKADNSGKIATTSWISTADCIVHKTGNETVAGEKTYTSNPKIKSVSEYKDATYQTTPYIQFYQGSQFTGSIVTVHDASNDNAIAIETKNPTTGKNAVLRLISKADGTAEMRLISDGVWHKIATEGWSIGKFVQKSGDTMTGNLTIQRASTPNIGIRATEGSYGDVLFYDSGSNRSAFVRGEHTSEYNRLVLGCSQPNGNTINYTMQLFNHATDGVYVITPTPSSKTDNTDKIATTKWVNQTDFLVHSYGNEDIDGIKTFKSKPIVRKAGYGSMDFINTNANPNTVGNWALMHGIGFYGTDGTNDLKLGGYYISTNGDGDPRTVIQTRRVIDGETKVGELEIRVKSDGSAIAYAPQPPQSANYTEIVTANWVNTKLADKITASTTDIGEGSALATGTLYLVYE